MFHMRTCESGSCVCSSPSQSCVSVPLTPLQYFQSIRGKFWWAGGLELICPDDCNPNQPLLHPPLSPRVPPVSPHLSPSLSAGYIIHPTVQLCYLYCVRGKENEWILLRTFRVCVLGTPSNPEPSLCFNSHKRFHAPQPPRHACVWHQTMHRGVCNSVIPVSAAQGGWCSLTCDHIRVM